MSRLIGISLIISLLCGLCVSLLYSQEETQNINSLKAGAWALQFGVGGNFTLSSFQGTSIAAKYHFTNRTAVRAGVTLYGAIGDGTSSNSSEQGATNMSSGSSGSSSNSVTTILNIQYLWYLNSSAPVQFYLAIGPSIAYSHTSSDEDGTAINSYASSYVTRSTSVNRFNQFAIGASGAAGVEWFPATWISLRAEYSEGIKYQWSSAKSTHTTTNSLPDVPVSTLSTSTTGKGWALNDQGVSFGLNIYF